MPPRTLEIVHISRRQSLATGLGATKLWCGADWNGRIKSVQTPRRATCAPCVRTYGEVTGRPHAATTIDGRRKIRGAA